MTRANLALGAAVLAIACALSTPATAAEQQVAYNPGGAWAIVKLKDGCALAVSTSMDEWEVGPGTFSWSGDCSVKGFIEGPGTLTRKYTGREHHADGRIEPFEREWHMHAAAENGLMHGIGEKSYGGPRRDQFKFAYGCSHFPDGAGGWTPPIANCYVEDGEWIAQEFATRGGEATLEYFLQLIAEHKALDQQK